MRKDESFGLIALRVDFSDRRLGSVVVFETESGSGLVRSSSDESFWDRKGER